MPDRCLRFWPRRFLYVSGNVLLSARMKAMRRSRIGRADPRIRSIFQKNFGEPRAILEFKIAQAGSDYEPPLSQS